MSGGRRKRKARAQLPRKVKRVRKEEPAAKGRFPSTEEMHREDWAR
jgi:hypothetical protein